MKKSLVIAALMTLTLTACNVQAEKSNGLPITRSEGAKRLKNQGEKDGFLIEFSYEHKEEKADVKVGMLGSTSWYLKGEEGIALKKEGEYYHVFTNSSWNREITEFHAIDAVSVRAD